MTRGTRLSPDWRPSSELVEFALSEGLTPGEITRAVDEFLDYWCDVPGHRGLKLGWDRTFKNRIRAIVDKRKPRVMLARPERGSILDIANELSLGLRARDA